MRNDEVLSYRLNQAAQISGLSRRTLEGYIRRGLLGSRKIGRSRVILRSELLRFLSGDRPSSVERS